MTRLEIAARIAAGMATNEEGYSPSFIAERSLFIADELIRLEAETRPKPEPEQELPFEMVVGGVYEMRNGEIDEIILNNGREFYLFVGKSGRWYSEKGRLFCDSPTPFDLIKRIR